MCNNDNENKVENKSEDMDTELADEQLENVAGGKVVKANPAGEKIYPKSNQAHN
ncbi:MAG: hypothetical protein Q4B54_12675 [Coriobacteriales bacterium]|nr:hypothetical protein [Coriobacteriales bacterium]